MIIKVTKDFRAFSAGDEFDFSIIDKLQFITIVGDNGSGKSSLFHALRGYKNDFETDTLYNDDFKELSKNIDVEHNYDKIFYRDAIKDNGSDMNVGYDASNYINSGGFHTHKLSHGQGTLAYIATFMEKQMKKVVPDKTLLVFDEIDNGLSLHNMSKFINFMHNITSKYKCHVLVISHNPFLISQSILCFDINKKKMVQSSKYILEQTGYKLKKHKEEIE